MSKLYAALPCEEAPRPSRCHGHCCEEALCDLCAAIAAKKHCVNSALLWPLLRRSTVWAALPCEEAPRTPHCYGHCCEEAPRTPHMITAARTCTSIAAEEVLCGSHRCRPACMSHSPQAQMAALTNILTSARNCTSIAVEEVLCGSHKRRPACMSHPHLHVCPILLSHKVVALTNMITALVNHHV